MIVAIHPPEVVLAIRAFLSIADDGRASREQMRGMTMQMGYATEAFSSAVDVPASSVFVVASCLTADVPMPSMTANEIHQRLADMGA